MKLTCKNCTKIYTSLCPIRVWGRNEGNDLLLNKDVNPDKDFCSRIEINFSLNVNEK